MSTTRTKCFQSVFTTSGLCLLGLGMLLLCASQERDCKQELGVVIRKQDEVAPPKGSQVYFMHTRIETEGKRQGYAKSEVKMLVGENKVVYLSTPLSYYKDAEATYTVVHPHKLITKSAGQPKKEMELRQQKVATLRDTILEQCKLVACQLDDFDGKKLRKITLMPKKESGLPIAQMIYYVDEKKQQVVKQEIYYAAGAALTKKTTTYLAMDFKSKQRFLPTAKDYLYENGKLRKELENYSVE